MNFVAAIDAGILAGWVGRDEDGTVISGFGPDGVATLVLDFVEGFTVSLSWVSSIIPHADGTEQRISTLDRPKVRFQGTAMLVDSSPRKLRSLAARYAAQGAVFLLGLPHLALPLVADAAGATLTVPAAALAMCDWKNPSQRIVVRNANGAAVDAVIQDVGASTIRIDVDPGVAGKAGGMIMPAMAVLLPSQQNRNRYRTVAERWEVDAIAAIFDFAPPSTSFDLGVVTGNAALDGAIVQRRSPALGDSLFFLSPNPSASLSEAGPITTVYFVNGVTTLGDVATLLLSSDSFRLTGTYNAAAVLHSGDSLSEDASNTIASGAMGTGATLTMYAGHPVWDRGLSNPATIQDTVQSMTALIDLDGAPLAQALAAAPQFGRTVAIAKNTPAELQWLLLFLCTVRGPQSMFWLPTWSPDLTWLSSGANQIVVRTDDGSDIGGWYPAQRDRLQIIQTDGAITYVQITEPPLDHGDGTQTVPIDTTLSIVAVSSISWLEPCRFEADDFQIAHKQGKGFSMSTSARAHAASVEELSEVEP